MNRLQKYTIVKATHVDSIPTWEYTHTQCLEKPAESEEWKCLNLNEVF